VSLLYKLLIAHICPTTKVSISAPRKEYKRLKGDQYPISEDELANNLVALPDNVVAQAAEDIEAFADLAEPEVE
jgi:hypothetical protein